MKNYVGPGQTVQFVSSGGDSSGDVLAMVTMAGIVANDVADTETGVAVIEGEFNLAKISTTVFAIGDSVDWDVSALKCGKGITPASGDIEDFAVALEVAGNPSSTVKVKLTPGRATVT